MQTQSLTIDRAQARELYRSYKRHAHYSAPMDREIQRIYQLIAQGRLVIKAIESIRLAGAHANGCPKLALIRADATECFFTREEDGSGRFTMRQGWRSGDIKRERVSLPAGTLPAGKAISHWNAAQAMVPIIPIHLRPKRGLANYHILFEAEWERIVPRDPMLLRRVGKGDAWLVVAAWDLTEIERSVMASRL